MKPALRQKEQFFHELVQLVRSAVALPQALEMLARNPRSPTARCAGRVRAALDAGGGMGRAFTEAGFSAGDAAVIEAGESSGRLEAVFTELETYYHQLADARQRILSRSWYPLLVLHLGAFLLAIPPALIEGGWTTFFLRSVPILLGFYLVVFLCWMGWRLVRRALAGSVSSARSVLAIPVLGGFLSDWTTWRFTALLSLYVRAGGGVLRAFAVAGTACQNALLATLAQSTVNDVKAGRGLAGAVQGQSAWPDVLGRALEVGDHSGRLDEETERAAGIYKGRALEKLETVSKWTPKLLYLALVLLMGWQAIRMIVRVYSTIGSTLELY